MMAETQGTHEHQWQQNGTQCPGCGAHKSRKHSYATGLLGQVGGFLRYGDDKVWYTVWKNYRGCAESSFSLHRTENVISSSPKLGYKRFVCLNESQHSMVAAIEKAGEPVQVARAVRTSAKLEARWDVIVVGDVQVARDLGHLGTLAHGDKLEGVRRLSRRWWVKSRSHVWHYKVVGPV